MRGRLVCVCVCILLCEGIILWWNVGVWALVYVFLSCQRRFKESSDVKCRKPISMLSAKWNVFDVTHSLCPVPWWERSSGGGRWIQFHGWPCRKYLKSYCGMIVRLKAGSSLCVKGVLLPQVFPHTPYLQSRQTKLILKDWELKYAQSRDCSGTENVLQTKTDPLTDISIPHAK